MPKMCSVTGCKSNYRSQGGYTKVYKLPPKGEQRDLWIHNIPRENLPQSNETVVCEHHWPKDTEFVTVRGGHKRPIGPPTIFPGIPKSQIPTPAPAARPTKCALSEVRSVIPDELDVFKEVSRVNFSEILSRVHSEIQPYKVNVYQNGDNICIQSWDFICGSVAKYLVKIKPDLSYEAFYGGPKCIISTLTSNRVHKLKEWGQILECIKFLENYEPSRKLDIHLEDLNSLNKIKMIGEKVYNSATIIRSFEYFAKSRTLYKDLVKDYQLPSITTLTKLTSKTCALGDFDFVKTIIGTLDSRQKQCIVLVDEVKVKPALLYQGGRLFGVAQNAPGMLANSVLAVMVVCMNGGPNFIAKMIPVKKVNAQFQFDIVKNVVKAIVTNGCSVISIINDNNRLNQSFMSMFITEPGKPWITIESSNSEHWNIPGNVFIFNDFVHLFKSLRNNWFTEKLQEISFHFPEDPTPLVAKWADLVALFNLNRCDDNNNDVIKPARHLNYSAVFPKPIERQNVPLMLKIFCDETVASLRTHFDETVNGTVRYIELWVKVWKILNVKRPFEDTRLRDERRAELRKNESSRVRLDFLIKMAEMVEKMDVHNGKLI